MPPSNIYKVSQIKRWAKAVGLADRRYTPKLNVKVSIATVFDGLGRTSQFYDQLKKPANELIKSLRSINDEKVNGVAAKEFGIAKGYSLKVKSLLLKIPNTGVKAINFKQITSPSIKARDAVSKCLELLRDAETKERKHKQEEAQSIKHAETERISFSDDEKYRDEKHYLYKINQALSSTIEFCQSNTALAANNPRLLLNGIAGSGKTHFLCDLTKYRIASDLPTFIYLGEEFNSKNPWDTVKGLLGSSMSNAAFIKALDRYAATKRTRAIIVVDAVNETQVSGVHWEHFNRIRRYKNLGVILSVRTGFEQSELPASMLNEYVRVEHEGFASHEWEAVTKFFAEYKLPLPEVPILFPEFRIPLFLKIFCESFANSSEPIKGHYGFTHIFEQYVKRQGLAVLTRLGETSNLGESRKSIWNGIIKELALCMGENGTDRVSERDAVSIAAKQFPSRGKKALGFLEKSWLVTKVPRYRKYKIAGFDYRFPYQKFSDHLIVRNLLSRHLNPASPDQSFKKGTKLHELIRDEWSNRGLIEALSIQVPERLRGRELVYVTPEKFRFRESSKDCFLESLIWRDLSAQKNGKPKYIRTKRALNYLNRYILPYRNGNEKILETLITVSAIPNHPLNALLLHSHLSKRSMPQKDALWLPYINTRYGDEGAVSRLLAWAWEGGDKTKIKDESLRLAGLTLGWFLASSNRFLRDRSTKALVSIFNGRIGTLVKVMEDFRNVKDPYIQERLYAVAYGCSLQPGVKKEDLTKLALYVYHRVFRDRRPPVHILLRDYARGVVETAYRQDSTFKTKIDIKRARPPYRSSFPSNIPTLDYLRHKYYPKRESSKPPKNGDYGAIWHSLMYNNEGGIADFGNYVVNSTLGHWCDLRFAKDGSRPKTVKELNTEFNSGLDPKQKREWDTLESIRRSVDMHMTLLSLPIRPSDKVSQNGFTKEQLLEAQKEIQDLEKAFIRGLSAKLQQLYKKGVLLYRKNPSGSNDLNVAEIQRLIFKRIVNLGWRPGLFGKYDSSVRGMDRDAHKSERIGKKYQWIAFHEMLGRITDNFVFRGNWRKDFRPYEGPWQMWERDIDPSCLLRTTPITESSLRPWWIKTGYNKWKPSLTHTEWTRVKNDLPNQKRLLEIKTRGGWLVLDGYVRWEQPPVPGDEKFDKIRRDVWYLVRSYIVKRKEAKKLFAWAKKQDFMGRWMPDPMELRNLFYGEYPHAIPYLTEYDTQNKKRWITIEGKDRKPTGLKAIQVAEEYNWEGSGFDCSVDDGIRVRLPSKELIKAMQLTHGNQVGQFANKEAGVVGLDPSVAESGPSVLLVKKKPLLDCLRRNNYEIVWAIIGEKLLLGSTGGGSGFLGRLEMGGAFRIGANGKLAGKTYTKLLSPHKN